MDVSENGGTPKSSILIGCSIINHPFWGTSIFGNTHMFFFWCSCIMLDWLDANIDYYMVQQLDIAAQRKGIVKVNVMYL